jgi:DNA-binding MurR/RpiR family transcriptional regulator
MAEHALISLGFSARACLNGRGNQALQLAQTTPQDLVIVISIWRYLSDTVDAATAARTAGATCIALTDSPVAPAAGIADHVLVAATEGATHSHSLTGLISLVDLISAAIAAQRPAESMAALRRIDQIYREYGVLMSE